MNVCMQVVCVSDDGSEQRRDVLALQRQELTMETLGMSLAESKALLEGVQNFVIAQQVSEDLEQRRACPHCGQRHTSKDSGSTPVKTLSVRCLWRIRGGTGAPAKVRARRHSGRRNDGSASEPVRRCFTWRPAGLR
jgi:hypothetical protein